MNDTMDRIENAVEDMTAAVSPGRARWTLPNGQNAVIIAPDGHLLVVHAETVTRWLETTKAVVAKLGTEIAKLTSALHEIASLARSCEDSDSYDGAKPCGPVTHTTKFNFVLDVYLCAEHAVTRAASLAKAESKGCGKQPPVVPYVETNEAVLIATRAMPVPS